MGYINGEACFQAPPVVCQLKKMCRDGRNCHHLTHLENSRKTKQTRAAELHKPNKTRIHHNQANPKQLDSLKWK
jgi:hypothetical protein